VINFRYHVVTLVAIFLALGIGVLFGSSFVSEVTVEVLRRNQARLSETNSQYQERIGTLETQNEQLIAFVSALKKDLVAGRLKDRPILIIASEVASREVADDVVQTLLESGGRVEGFITLSENLDLQNETRRSQVALVLGVSETAEPALRTQLVGQLTEALTGRRPGLLQRLLDAKLAAAVEMPGAQPRPPSQLASPGTATIVVGAQPGGESRLEETLFVPLARSLGAEAVVAACEAQFEGLRLVRLIREDPGIRAVTVDGCDGPVGQAALALGLEAAFGGRFGHYGAGDGASGLLPIG